MGIFDKTSSWFDMDDIFSLRKENLFVDPPVGGFTESLGIRSYTKNSLFEGMVGSGFCNLLYSLSTVVLMFSYFPFGSSFSSFLVGFLNIILAFPDYDTIF